MLRCDRCGKDMVNERTGLAFVGMTFNIVEADNAIPEDVEFMQRQLGPYKVGHAYHICFQCMMESFGVDPQGGVEEQ